MQQHFLLVALGAIGAFVLSQFADQADATMHASPTVQEHPSRSHHQYELLRPPIQPNLINSVNAADDVFISQYRSPFNPEANEANSNCGPASLAMALKRFYPDVPVVQEATPQKLVRMARLAMTGLNNDYQNTDNDDVIRGARILGLRAQKAPTLAGIDAALQSGALAIVSGSPSVAGSFGERLPYKHCHNGHFITLVGKEGNNYLMNDPESPTGSVAITRSELSAFISYWPAQVKSLHGAVALWPSAGPAEGPAIAELARQIM